MKSYRFIESNKLKNGSHFEGCVEPKISFDDFRTRCCIAFVICLVDIIWILYLAEVFANDIDTAGVFSAVITVS
jgi:hypothetical protein